MTSFFCVRIHFVCVLDTTSLIHIKIIPVHLRLRTGRECHQCLVQTRPLGPPQECAPGAAVARPAREEAPQLAVASRLPHLSLHGDQSRHSLQLAEAWSCLCLRTTARYVYSTTKNNLSHARMVNDSWWKKKESNIKISIVDIRRLCPRSFWVWV